MNKGLFIITGANGGMGKAITKAIAGTGVPVVMACRNVERAAGVRDEIVRETGCLLYTSTREVTLPLLGISTHLQKNKLL